MYFGNGNFIYFQAHFSVGMGKSRAEIQRAYRERLKEKNKEAYLKSERDRTNSRYVSSTLLSENDRNERNRRNRENLRRFYQKRKAERTRQRVENDDTSSTSGYESAERYITSLMMVKGEERLH